MTRRLRRSARRFAIFCFVIACGCGEFPAARAADADDSSPAGEEERAGGPDVVAALHLDAPLAPGRSVVWTAAFPFAWRAMAEGLGGPLRFADAQAQALADALDAEAVGIEAVAPGDAVYALGGRLDRDALERLGREMAARFPEKTPGFAARLRERSPHPDRFFGYACLVERLRFVRRLERQTAAMRFGDAWVETFRSTDETGTDPIRLLAFESLDNFVVALRTTDAESRLLLARMDPPATLREAVDRVLERVDGKEGRRLPALTHLFVPVLDLALDRRAVALDGAAVTAPQTGRVEQIGQSIRFRLDETGATVEAEAEIGGVFGMDMPLRCNGPFLVLLSKRGAARPYVALWVGNSAFMIPASKAAARLGEQYEADVAGTAEELTPLIERGLRQHMTDSRTADPDGTDESGDRDAEEESTEEDEAVPGGLFDG